MKSPRVREQTDLIDEDHSEDPSKGQITLRKAALEELGVRPGDCVIVETVGPGRLEVRAATRGASIDEFIGCAARPGGPVLHAAEEGFFDPATKVGLSLPT